MEQPILRYKNDIEAAYASILAPYATKMPMDGSREYAEVSRDVENRADFQRDRDRIIHSQAFRRMMYKTQVFVNHEGDHFRTRLTHSLEVAQFARGISKSLALNEDLAEAIALGHDLGHTPFGHAAESVFSRKFAEVGLPEFYHNEQSVRVAQFLENRNPEVYKGLNLTHEVREGMLKHNGDRSGRFPELMPGIPCGSLEGQIVKIVDTVAYTCHDLDDGIKSGILSRNCMENSDNMQKFKEIKQRIYDETGIEISYVNKNNNLFISQLIHWFVRRLTESTYKNLISNNVYELSDVKRLAAEGVSIVAFDESAAQLFKALKEFVTACVYRTATVQMMDAKAELVVSELYDAFFENPNLLPPEQRFKVDNYGELDAYAGLNDATARAMIVCDYISCMTDRYALDEHERVFNPRVKI